MARLRTPKRLKDGSGVVQFSKPWRAECKVNYQTYFLGYFPDKEKAEAEEREFRIEMTGKPTPGHTDCLCHTRKDMYGSL